MVVVTSPGLWVEPETTVQRVATVLSERGERVTAPVDRERVNGAAAASGRAGPGGGQR